MLDSLFSGLPVWGIIQILLIIGLLVYVIFAGVIIRQVNLMTATLDLGHKSVIKGLAIAHLLFALSVLLFAILVL